MTVQLINRPEWERRPVRAVVDAGHVLRVGRQAHGHVLPIRVVGAQVIGRDKAEYLRSLRTRSL